MPLTLLIHARHPRRTLMLHVYDSSVETTALSRAVSTSTHGIRRSHTCCCDIQDLTADPAHRPANIPTPHRRHPSTHICGRQFAWIEGRKAGISPDLWCWEASACALRRPSTSEGLTAVPHPSFRSWTVIGRRPARSRSRTEVGEHHLSSR